MYSHLRGEMFRAKITVAELAGRIGVTEKTLRNKINGTSDFTWPEACAIRDIVSPGADMEDLFKTDPETVPAG